MRRHSPPRRAHGGRGRSPPPRRGYGGHGGRKEQGAVSLLVRNIPVSCRFGPVRDVYLPRDYYSGEPRGFAFVEFVDSVDASEAQYHMNRQMFSGCKRRHEKGLRICVDELESEVILIMRAAVLLAMDGLILVHVHVHAPALLAIVAMLDHGPTLLPQEGEMTTLLPQRERKSAGQNHQDGQKNMMWIRSGGPILRMIEMAAVMLIMVTRIGGGLQRSCFRELAMVT